MSVRLGIDVGGTKVLGGIVDESGSILQLLRRDTPKLGGDQLNQVIVEIAQELRKSYEVKNIGISAAGFISSDRERIYATPNIRNWNERNLSQEISELLKIPVIIENDANCALWGEKVFGAAAGLSDVLMLTLGTGLGGAFIAKNELYRGGFGIASEFGHMRAVPGGVPCGCGVAGCFEQYASGSALVRFAQELIARSTEGSEELLALVGGSPSFIKGSDLTEGAKQGNPLARQSFTLVGQWLGALCANLTAALDPEVIIIGGGLVQAQEFFIPEAERSLLRHLPFSGLRPGPKIIPALLGNDAGLIGAAELSAL
jgi:glucokinase